MHSSDSPVAGDGSLQDLLQRTSRTFALNIPLLPEPLRSSVAIAYLLFRIADSVEDGITTSRDQKRELFEALTATFGGGTPWEFCSLARRTPPHESADCCDLIQRLPGLLDELDADPTVAALVRSYVRKSAVGMGQFTRKGGPDGAVRLGSLAELDEYCYVVAGIVGEMLTELFIHHEPQLSAAEEELMAIAPVFGEGLQLVNILKDSGDDSSGGRQFVPESVSRETLFQRAREDLRRADSYCDLLEKNGASTGILQFTRLPVRLAFATLEKVERNGPGAKISRERVMHIVSTVDRKPRDEPMKVLLAAPRGFCAGVRMAVQALELVIERLGPPVYVFHEIVHNRHVVDGFTAQGAVFVDTVDEVPDGSVLVFSAHGVAPGVREAAKAKQLVTIDATCPLVAKVHVEAVRFAKLGYQIVLIGHEGHDEVVGTVGEAVDAITVVSSISEIEALSFSDDTPLAWLTQTTLSVSETAALVQRLEEKFPGIVGPPSEDICYATQNRQAALAEICPDADAVVVVGSQNSSNSRRLLELSTDLGKQAWLIDDSDALSPDDFRDFDAVAVTAGASAPDSAVENVLDWFAIHFDAVVELRTKAKEDRVFALPPELVTLSQADRTIRHEGQSNA